MRRRFDITLANLQSQVFHLAQGRNGEKAGWVELTSEYNTIKEACSSVKFRTTGWRNINLTELVLFSVSLVSLWISTIKYKSRILLVWLFVSLTGREANRFYSLVKNGFKAMITIFAECVRLLQYLLSHHSTD